MNDLTLYSRLITLHSADWWDDPSGFYPAYYTAGQLEDALPASAKESLALAGLWPPPGAGLTLLGGGVVRAGDARAEFVKPAPYVIPIDQLGP